MTLSARQTGWLFAMLAATVYTAVFFVTRSQPAMAHPGPIGMAALCDLLITVPFLYYMLIVRQGRSSWLAVMAVLFAGARAAVVLLPAAQQTGLPGLRWMGVPFELWVIAAVVRRLRRMNRGTDTVSRIRAATRAVFRSAWAAEMVASEIEVVYYALFAWRARPQTREGHRQFFCAEASGYSLLAMVLAVALIFEGVPVHLLLARWSRAAAWTATTFDGYALIWLAALARSLRLCPMLVGERTILLQAGIAWRIEVARENIKSCRRFTGEAPERGSAGYLQLVVMNAPQWIVELREPAQAAGIYGRRRAVTCIGVAVDDAEAFGAAVTASGRGVPLQH